MGTHYRHQIRMGEWALARFLIITLVIITVLQASGRWWLEAQATDDPIPAAEFSRIIQDFSEQSGSYSGERDNFTSNESGYLKVVNGLKTIPVRGDAYIGVEPEQNFTYIAKLRPRIAFIVDIRRQAIIQHLMYKAIFHISEDRASFLEALLSRPLAGSNAPGRDASIRQLTAYFSNAKADEHIFESNLAEIQRMICDVFQIPLSSKDQSKLRHIYQAFRKRGLDISFGKHPTLKELIEKEGPDGSADNFLAAREDYEFVRGLQLRNRIIPVVGDFAGPKAIRSVSDYLRKNSYSVAVFYTSNVETILIDEEKFRRYVTNISKLPITNNTFFIRWLPGEGKLRMGVQQMETFFKYYLQTNIYLNDFDRLLKTHAVTW